MSKKKLGRGVEEQEGQGGVAVDEQADGFYETALALVKKYKRCSVEFLKRKMKTTQEIAEYLYQQLKQSGALKSIQDGKEPTAKADEEKTAQDLVDEHKKQEEAKSAEPVDADGLKDSQKVLFVEKSLKLSTLYNQRFDELNKESKAKKAYDDAKKLREKTDDEIISVVGEIRDIESGNYQNVLPFNGSGEHDEEITDVEDDYMRGDQIPVCLCLREWVVDVIGLDGKFHSVSFTGKMNGPNLVCENDKGEEVLVAGDAEGILAELGKPAKKSKGKKKGVKNSGAGHPMDIAEIESAVLRHLNNSKKKGKAITPGTLALAVYGSKSGQEKDRAVLIIRQLEGRGLVERDAEAAKSEHGQKYHVIWE